MHCLTPDCSSTFIPTLYLWSAVSLPYSIPASVCSALHRSERPTLPSTGAGNPSTAHAHYSITPPLSHLLCALIATAPRCLRQAQATHSLLHPTAPSPQRFYTSFAPLFLCVTPLCQYVLRSLLHRSDASSIGPMSR